DTQPKQLSLFDENDAGVRKVDLRTRAEIERDKIDPDEFDSLRDAQSVLQRIASNHLNQDKFVKALINIAPRLAAENPVELLVRMAQWMIEDLNSLGNQFED